MHTWVNIATLIKKRHAPGRFVVRCQANLLLCMKPGLSVAFVPPVLDAPRSATILDVTQTSDTTLDVTFAYNNYSQEFEQEEELIGLHVLAPRNALDSEATAFEAESLCGFSVIDDKEGFIGEVKEIVQKPGQDLLVVSRVQGDTNVLIPQVHEIVYDIDCAERTIRVRLPIGLLEL